MTAQLLPPSTNDASDVQDTQGAIAGRHSANSSLIGALVLAERDLSAVERFAASQTKVRATNDGKNYRDLIPLTNPSPGEQYAFEVDLDACTGCKACVSGCHHLNGLDAFETWRAVGELRGDSIGERNELPLLQHVTTACHHCVEPACLMGCPTNAYVKDAETGIVRHLDDQCFGCHYCTMACPYDVPQYNPRLGIVRKCDMCHGRLSVGEAPACVQACPTQAIRITVVNAAAVSQRLSAGHLLPNSPPSTITTPTTIYRSALPLPTTLASSSLERLQPQHAHWALVVMLVLTQLSVGAATTGGLILLLSGQSALHALGLSLISGVIGLMAATAHLGRPHLAFRGVLGWRHSWLSREAIAFGLFMGSLCLWITDELLVHALSERVTMASSELLAFLTVGMGWAGVFCSARIYQFTQREFWRGSRTSVKFLLTTLLFAEATTLLCFAAEETRAVACHTVIRVLILTLLVKLTYESVCCISKRSHGKVLFASHYLMWQPLRTVTVVRWTIAGMTVAAGLMLSVVCSAPGGDGGQVAIAWSMLVLLLVGELLERWLFFAAVVPWRMPGGRCA